MKFNVIIPVIRRDLFSLLLADLCGQSVLPELVIIIDNSRGLDAETLKHLPFEVYLIVPNHNIGVNPAWNWGVGLAKDCDAVAILNDDIRLGSEFFHKISIAFGCSPDAAAVCPLTNSDDPDAHRIDIPYAPKYLSPMRKREGWAMVIRRQVLDQIPPIPDALRIFCGDDWFWYWSHRMGRPWIKDLSNVIYHQVGASMMIRPEARQNLKAEKAAFARIIRALEAEQ